MTLPSKISALETQLAAKRARYAELEELIPKLAKSRRSRRSATARKLNITRGRKSG